MARPKSEDKHHAILRAATGVFARRGVWLTPTSAISRAAGVAEGTLFTYFATKEVLMNELYRALKRELAEVLLEDLPEDDGPRDKFRHLWDAYIRWGVEHPDKVKVMAELRLSDKITPQSRDVGSEPFAEVETMARDAIRRKLIRNYPLIFLGAMMNGMAETTMALIAEQPRARKALSASGFEMFWNGIRAA